MPESTVTTGTGPPVARKPCVHDSRRLDGYLDVNCLRCGADGYWRDGKPFAEAGEIRARIHPSGKILLREAEHPPAWAEEAQEAVERVRAALGPDGTAADVGAARAALPPKGEAHA